MPLPIMLAHKLVRQLSSEVRRAGILNFLRPDGKSQVTVEYVDGKPVRIDAVVVSTQHSRDVSQKQLRGRSQGAHHRAGPSRRHGRCEHQVPHQSHRPVRASAGPTATPASPAARSSSTPTAAWAGTAAAPSRARTRRRWTARPATWRGYIAKNIVAAGLATPLRSAARLRHRRGRPGVGDGRYLRHGRG